MKDVKEVLQQWFLIKKTSGGATKNKTNKELAEELHKPIIWLQYQKMYILTN